MFNACKMWHIVFFFKFINYLIHYNFPAILFKKSLNKGMENIPGHWNTSTFRDGIHALNKKRCLILFFPILVRYIIQNTYFTYYLVFKIRKIKKKF